MRQRFRNKKERARRVEEAAERQARYDALTTVQKFARVRNPAGREGSRLVAILNDDTMRQLEAAGKLVGIRVA